MRANSGEVSEKLLSSFLIAFFKKMVYNHNKAIFTAPKV